MMAGPSSSEIQWCFSQVKGTLDDDVTDADIISCVEFNQDGDLLATGDKGGRVVIFQRDPTSKNSNPRRGEYNVYSTFQSHEPEFDYLKSLEIEEKINKIRWLKRKNPAHFLLSTNDKTIKLWKVSERDRRAEGYNLKEDNGLLRDPASINTLRVPVLKPMELMVEASPRRIFANAHTYHINSISVNSDGETYLSADDLRINLWHMEITDQSFNIVDIKPANMEELTEVITASEFHPKECNLFVYSSSKGTIRLCDMRQAALCDSHAKMFEEPEDPTNRSFFSEIISSISDVKFSNSGRYMISRDYLSVKVWDLHMETKPIETYTVHEYLRSKLCSLYENDCIFDKFECCWNGNDTAIMTGSYNNFFRMFDRNSRKEVTCEASREIAKPKTLLKPRKVSTSGKRKKGEIYVDCLDFNKKILHTAWHPQENIIAVAATNNLFLLQDKFWAGNGDEVVVDVGVGDDNSTANKGDGGANSKKSISGSGDAGGVVPTNGTAGPSHEAVPNGASQASPSKPHIVIDMGSSSTDSDTSTSNHTLREQDAAEGLSNLSSPSPQPRSSSASPQPASSSLASSSSAYESTSSIDSAPSSEPATDNSCSDLESTTATSIEARNQEELSDSADEVDKDEETAK